MDNRLGTITLIQNLNGTLSGESNVSGSLNSTASVDGEINIPTMVAIGDHERLTGRDKPNQHPIEAISGLKDILDHSLLDTDVLIINCGTSTEVNHV